MEVVAVGSTVVVELSASVELAVLVAVFVAVLVGAAVDVDVALMDLVVVIAKITMKASNNTGWPSIFAESVFGFILTQFFWFLFRVIFIFLEGRLAFCLLVFSRPTSQFPSKYNLLCTRGSIKVFS